MAAAAALAGGAWLGRARVGAWLSTESPETQVRRALSRLDRLQLPAADATVDLHPVRFSDVVTAVEGGRATAVALVEADGRVSWAGGEAALGYVGRERLRLSPCRSAGWCADGPPLERLAGVVGALRRRAAGDAGARVLAWQIRVEREAAEVGEDVDRPAEGGTDRRARRVYHLAREDDRWVFTSG